MRDNDIWTQFLLKIKNKVSLMTYNYMFNDLELYSYDEGNITIIVPDNELLLQNITKNYLPIMEEILNDLTNDTCNIEFIFKSDVSKRKKTTPKVEEKQTETFETDISTYKYSSNFNPKYTFETFVVGESNKLAYGTAIQVAKNPGKLYNPYFLYARSGLGKTHLMHAIGNYIVTHSDKKVLYITSEQFINDYVSIINTKSKNDNNITYLEAFREKYRNVDVLMIDDIQFLEKATKSQIEFTNTFNTLYDNEKQIIIASDTSVDDYKYLEDRLKTRFRWGLTESINPPEVELKKSIIRNKIILNDFDIDLSEDVIEFIANNCGSDIRNLENSVIRLVAYKVTLNIPVINLEIAQEALKDYVTTVVYKANSVSRIISEVAKYYGLDPSMIKGKMKKKNIADARAIAMYLSCIMTDESLERIGLEIGGRDHSTIVYSRDKITKELKTNANLNEEIKILKEKICE